MAACGPSSTAPARTAPARIAGAAGSLHFTAQRDTDGDGVMDRLDTDDDGDGIIDDMDDDDDGDGILDQDEPDHDHDGIIDDYDSDSVELEGEITMIGDSAFTAFDRSVRVDDQTIITGENDQILAFTDLMTGMWVEVEGTMEPDGSIHAHEVEAEDNDGGVIEPPDTIPPTKPPPPR